MAKFCVAKVEPVNSFVQCYIVFFVVKSKVMLRF